MEVEEDVNSTIGTEMDSSTHVSKKEAPKLIEKYFYQLTQGCGNPECHNQYCASSPTFYHRFALTPNEAAAQALKLLRQKVASFCISKGVESHKSENSISKSDHATSDTVDQEKPGPSQASLPSSSQQAVKPVIGLSEELIQDTMKQCCISLTDMQWSPLIKLIGSSYSDLDVLMKSFRSKPTDDDGGRSQVLDLASLQRAHKIMFSLAEDAIYTALINAIINVATTLSIELQYRSGYEGNANLLDVIKIILEIPCLHSPEFLDRAYPEFLTAMNYLPLAGQNELVLYLASRGTDYLRNFLQSLQQLITVRIVSQRRLWNSHNILNNDNYIIAAARVIKFVYYASLKAGEVDPPEILEKEKEYCNTLRSSIQEYLQSVSDSSIKERTGIKRDPLAEALSVRRIDCRVPALTDSEFINDLLNETLEMDQDFTYYKAGGDKFTFMLHPFLLNTTNKSLAMYYDNRIRMISERRSALMSSMLHGAPSMPYLRLRVRRDHIIDDALVGLEMTFMDNPDDLKKQLYVEFEGEQGIDEGGVSKEFFQLIVEEIFNPDFGMFVYREETRQFWFNSDSYENGAQFTLVGILLGLAIYNHVILDVHLPLDIYRKLLGKLGTLQDMELSHPVQYLSLKQLLDYEGNVEEDIATTFTLSYTNVFGEMVTHLLKDHGNEIIVTNDNRQEFANLYADYLLNKLIAEQFSAFNRGFHMVVDESPLEHLVNAVELELLVCGSQDWDVTALEATTEYSGDYDRNDETVRYFWEAVHSMTADELRKLLQFTTGSDRVPVGGMAKLKLVIAKNGPDSDRLPTSHTCFNVLLLPDYKNKEKVKRLLLLAITHAKGFGML